MRSPLELVRSPVGLVSPPGDPRLFVLEKAGRIRIIRDGAVLPAPFLDLSARVSRGEEQGLLGPVTTRSPAFRAPGRRFGATGSGIPGGSASIARPASSTMEGTRCFESSSCGRSGLTLPVLDYSHADGCSVTGGYVYRGAAIAGLQGTYFYGDYCAGWVRSFRFAEGRVTELTEWPDLAVGFGLTSFGEDAAGELYILSRGGTVRRVVPR